MQVSDMLHVARWKYRMWKWRKKSPSGHRDTAEIGSGVCSTAANFNGFHVLAVLLHLTLCGVEQRAPPIFGRGMLGIGPHSS